MTDLNHELKLLLYKRRYHIRKYGLTPITARLIDGWDLQIEDYIRVIKEQEGQS